MPPKAKVTKEDIVNTAVDLVRKNGAEAINARTIASALNCSTQPIFSNFATMTALREKVIDFANALYENYTQQDIALHQYPIYKATGMAYIRFAKEEKELFKLLFMRDRSGEEIPPFSSELSTIVQEATGLSKENAERFHLEIWAFVHGIATMLATGYLSLDLDFVSSMITDAYQGMRKQYGKE